MLAQDPVRAVLQLKQAEVEKPEHLRLMLKSFHQQGNDPGNGGAWILVLFEACPQFLADPQTAQSGFSCGPEQVSFSRKVPKDGNFTNPCQASDLVGTAGRETLARE